MGVFSKYKVYINYIITVFIVFFGVSFVFGSNMIFEEKLELKKISNNIFIGVENLDKNLVVYSSDLNLSDYNLSTGCEIESKYLGKKEKNYYFAFSYKENCLNPNIYLKNSEGNILKKSFIKIDIFSERKIFEMFSDSNLVYLNKFEEKLNKSIKFLEKKLQNFGDKKENFEIIKNKRLLEENNYKRKILKKVISGKNKKYNIPVFGHKLPIGITKIPNAGRGYRSSYTDGIHHGWDIKGYFGEEVVAIDDGVILRIVDNFAFENLLEIKKGKNLTEFEKIKNLDLLRGNQVWLKTTKGDVIFYSHLNEIYSTLKVGNIIKRGQALGTIGISGVPDKSYTNYHLHFPIMKNPKLRKKIGKYEIDDYLNWDWYFKEKSLEYVLENQNKIFYN